jgi:hypothetical protein
MMSEPRLGGRQGAEPTAARRKRPARVSAVWQVLAVVVVAAFAALAVFVAKGVSFASEGFAVRLAMATAALWLATLPVAVVVRLWSRRTAWAVTAWGGLVVVLAALMVWHA